MTTDELNSLIAELVPQEERAWAEAQKYEQSDEYKKPKAHCEALYSVWSDLHRRVEAFKLIAKEVKETKTNE